MQHLILDFETYSEADLKKVGAWEYSKHPSTEIICAAWSVQDVGGEWLETQVRTGYHLDFLAGLLARAADLDVGIVAHNAYFEQCIIRNVLSRTYFGLTDLSPAQFTCTAAMAASHALPRDLEGACLALDLPVKKDMEGRRLMMKYMKPRKPSKHNPETRWADEAELERIRQYCATDIEAERLLFERLPLLNETEQKVWQLDQKINLRGFRVDRPVVESALDMIATETEYLNDEFQKLTGHTPRQLEQVKKLLPGLPDLTAKTVQDALTQAKLTPKQRRILEIRQATSKTSTAKYEAFEKRSRSDGRIRDSMIYHTASTGRWGGAGVQPQNFPRGTIENTDLAVEAMRTGDLELVRMLYDNPMNVFSSCLRGMIIPTPGEELFCADYNAIETRALFWLAGHDAGVRAFHENRDLYKEMASAIYRKDINDIDKKERQLGKTAILGAGYGMGPKKFLLTCEAQNIEVSEAMAESAIRAYRNVHHPISDFWKATESAAIRAASKPGREVRCDHLCWIKEGDFLYVELPSHRRLAYYMPEIKFQPTPWGDRRPVLYHYSVNTLTKQWDSSHTYGGKLVENVVQAVARDLMAEAMLGIEAAGFDILLSVHDEIVAEAKTGKKQLEEFCELMGTLPLWAKGFPMKVEGWKGFRYRK